MSADPRQAGEQLSVVVLGDCCRCPEPIRSNQPHVRWRSDGVIVMAHIACEYPTTKEDHHNGDEVPDVQPGGGTA